MLEKARAKNKKPKSSAGISSIPNITVGTQVSSSTNSAVGDKCHRWKTYAQGGPAQDLLSGLTLNEKLNSYKQVKWIRIDAKLKVPQVHLFKKQMVEALQDALYLLEPHHGKQSLHPGGSSLRSACSGYWEKSLSLLSDSLGKERGNVEAHTHRVVQFIFILQAETPDSADQCRSSDSKV